MFYYLYYLRDIWFGFNVFKYITFRASMASITSFMITIFFGYFLIDRFKRFNICQVIKDKNVFSLYRLHKHKESIPTMGGIFILAGIIFSVLLWAKLENKYIWLCLFVLVSLGIVGFIDDYIKFIRKKGSGLKISYKLIAQFIIGFIAALILYLDQNMKLYLELPFFKNVIINLGYFFIPFVILVIISASNAVNLTDGLDGLAIGCIILVSLTYAGFSYVTGNVKISNYLNVFYLPGVGEVSIFCTSLIGAGLGFLWFNSHPASIFMGDTGSLSLGGTIGIVAVLTKKEILLLLAGGIFVLEALSVILQIGFFKWKGKRIFQMAPLHHHFQLKGWPETKVTARFLIIAILLTFLTLATLKLR